MSDAAQGRGGAEWERTESTSETAERVRDLWMIAVSPTIWAVHFLASYWTAAVWCAKAEPGAALAGVRLAVATFTVLALAGILYTAWDGLRRHQYGSATVPHDFDTADDRHRFLGFATVLLSGLSAVGVLYVALPALFFASCH